MAFLPFPSEVIIALSVVEFLGGMTKSSGKKNKTGIILLALFSCIEAASGVLIVASIISQIGKLQFALSKLIFSLAIITDLIYLAGDILFAYFTIENSEDENMMEKVKITLTAISLTLLCMSPSVALTLIGFSHMEWSVSSALVTELVSSKNTAASFWLCIAGLFLILLPIVAILIYYIFKFTNVYYIADRLERMFSPAWVICIIVGASLISGAGLGAAEELAPGHMFVTLTVLPPAASSILTFFKAALFEKYNKKKLESNDSESAP